MLRQESITYCCFSDDENLENEHVLLEDDKASPVASPPLNDNFVLAEHNFEPFILKTGNLRLFFILWFAMSIYLVIFPKM